MRAGGHYDLPAAQIVLGTVWLCRGLPERALEPFVQAVAVERSPRTLLPLAWCYLHLAMPQEATPLLHEAISRADGCPSVLADALAGLEQVTDGTTARNAQGEGLDPGNRSQVRWLPQPCCSGPFPCCLVRERFAEALPDGWRWHDPFGDAVWRVADGLIVEAPNDRNLWGLNHGAPRLLRTHGGGFALQAICSAASPHRPAIGGLVVWKDGQNYLRLDRGARGQDEVMFSGCVANQDRLFGRGRLPAARLWLRLERTEEKVRALCSVDGSSWLAVGETEFPAADPVEAGLHAIGTIDRLIYPGPYPEGTAIRFENCEIWT